jgi:regulator of sigma E protease
MQILQIIIALSILVLIHELGHYTFARIFGIRIDKFFLFFDAGGIKLFSTRSGWFVKLFPKAADWETEYGIGWLPLGGYCKVNGMIDESMDTEHLKNEPQPYEFRSKKAWQRLLVMFGGVLFNFILGIMLFSFSLYNWGDTYIPAEGSHIYVYEEIGGEETLGKKMGFQTGDMILALDGKAPGDFRQIQIDMARDMVSTVTVQRDNDNGGKDTIDLYIDHKYIPDILNTQLFELAVPFTITALAEDSPNTILQVNDKIVELDSTQIRFVQDALPVLKEKAGKEVEATILRDTSLIVTTLSVKQDGNIGVYFSIPNVQRIKYSFAESIPAGLQKAYDATIGQIKDMRLLAKPSTGAYKSVGSVIAITEAMPQQWNWYAFIHILAMISIILAVMNLLPIPALDGGHIVFTIYEMITGRKPSDQFLYVMQLIGMILIFGLMFLAFGNDIARLMK